MAGYDPKQFEQRWYQTWVEGGGFAPAETGEPFSIVIPPPNITGSLHMGHALNNTLQDILCRYQRMLGKAVLWVPGTDHAGIATQNVVERQLLAEGRTRDDLGREAFVERVWRWRSESGGTITEQLRRLGVSCDWNRERFTMDEGLSKAVREVFVSLYEEGLITRDRYLINWCPRCGTALSDIEVEHEEKAGHLWHLRYPLEDGSGSISVATTRPETMLGDTAVAVNPGDERYRALVGKNVVLPVVGRLIPIIADAYVDMAFGSGAVKITPGHDPNDFEMGQRHALQMISVMNPDATMSPEAGEYAGLSTQECRASLVARFAADGTLERTEEYRHSVGSCYRCHEVVEPLLSLQWFLRVREMADETLRVLDEGGTRFVPSHWEKTYRAWMENIRPWCISRQLWWGHRIPAWYCDSCDRTVVSREEPGVCKRCEGRLKQDEDVLDTWFSSALWPFTTMGWPEESEDLRRFYPTSVLVTGFDIIFFWVARMMMMGLRFMGEAPFREVYIHALVRDQQGQKMSKSKGNVIDPLEIIDKYGADAFRFTLAAFAAMGRDVRLSEERIVGYRNFINKIWNAARFAEIQRDEAHGSCAMPERLAFLPNRWIRSRFADVVSGVSAALNEYRFNEAASRLYQFTWHEFCDWYIEMAKVELVAGMPHRQETLATLTAVFESLLRVLHPFIPFVTEELWQQLPQEGRNAGLINHAPWPDPAGAGWVDSDADQEVATLTEVIRAVRNVRAEMNIGPSVELELYVAPGEVARVVHNNEPLLVRLAKLATVHYGFEPPEGCATTVAQRCELSVPVAEHVDIVAEVARLSKEIGRVEGELKKLDGKLTNRSFLDRAPAEVVERNRSRAEAARGERDTLLRSLERVQALGVKP
ncbi:MAG: valine--tRNA ligase [Candidatus Binatia bacterium]